MKEYRAKTAIKALASAKVNTMVGVQTYEFGEEDWTVMIAPAQVIDVIRMATFLNLHGFGLQFGPIEGADGKESWMLTDRMPEALPAADVVEDVDDDEESLEELIARAADAAEQMQRQRMNREARVGGEGQYDPEEGP